MASPVFVQGVIDKRPWPRENQALILQVIMPCAEMVVSRVVWPRETMRVMKFQQIREGVNDLFKRAASMLASLSTKILTAS